MKVYRDLQADLKFIKNENLLIIGYGGQGRAFALNLRDSGIAATVCLKPAGKSRILARADNMPIISPAQINGKYGIFLFMLPDHLHGIFFEKHIKKRLSDNSCLVFAHAYSVHFGLVKAPPTCDAILVAPHGPGSDLREAFLRNSGISCFVAAGQDHSGLALKKSLSIARAIGSTRVGAFETTFEQEALGDIFGEQALLCGGLAELVENAYNILIENGLTPENAYLETVNQIDLLARLIRQHGIHGMSQNISMTAQYGMLKTSGQIIDKAARQRLNQLFGRIKSGKFAREWQAEYASGMGNLKRFKKGIQNAEIEKTSKKMRKILGK